MLLQSFQSASCSYPVLQVSLVCSRQSSLHFHHTHIHTFFEAVPYSTGKILVTFNEVIITKVQEEEHTSLFLTNLIFCAYLYIFSFCFSFVSVVMTIPPNRFFSSLPVQGVASQTIPGSSCGEFTCSPHFYGFLWVSTCSSFLPPSKTCVLGLILLLL